jgi:hypothetical protein
MNDLIPLDPSASAYKLAEARAQERVAEFAAHPNPSTLEQELALCRFLIEEAVNSKSHNTAAVLLTTLNKLSRSHESAAIRNQQLLSRTVVVGICSAFLRIVADEFKHLPGWESRFDAASTRITQAIEQAVNPIESYD